MPLQAWVARFVVDHGRVTEEGGLLRSFQRRRLDEPDVDLHILAEPTGVKGQDLGAQAIENIGKLFLEDRLSLTGGLLRAVRSTHQTLLDWNRRSIPREQVTAGVTAALVRGSVVHLCQAGPSLCFLGEDDRLQRLAVEDEAAAPLGEGVLEPALRRIDLQPGQLILAASGSLLSVIDEETLEAVLGRGTEEALPELYLLTRDLPNFGLMAITCVESEDDDAATAEVLAPEQPLALQGGDDEPVSRAAPELFSDRPRAAAADAEPKLVLPPPLVDISRPIVRLRGDGSIGRGEYARTTGARPAWRLDLSQTRLLVMAGAVTLVLFVGAFAVPDLIRENRGEQIAGLLQSAQAQLGSGAAETDAARRRVLLQEASALASEVLRLDPENETAGAVRQQAVAALTQIDAVFDLGPMTTVATFSRQLTGEVSLDAMVIAGGRAYLLDGKGGRVLSVALSGTAAPATVFEDGATYGGTPAKKPQFFTWEGSESGGRLLVLDAERKLFGIRPGSTPEPLPLRRTNTWSSVAGIAAYDGNFYVLDATGNQVHRYLPAAAGFDSEPGPALNGQNDLREAVGLAVDGDIFVLKRQGQVLRFQAGNGADFRLGGIDRQITGANAIKVASTAGEVYIADAGNKRIVIADKNGAFLRQFVSSDLTDIRAMGVDEAAGQLYVVVGDALLTAPIVR